MEKRFIISKCCDAPILDANLCSECGQICDPKEPGLFELLGEIFNPQNYKL